MFVDVFGGSAAVTLAAANLDGDLVNLFRTVAGPATRRELFKRLRWLPASRRIFDEDGGKYLAGGHSFQGVEDSIERARCTLYRACFAFGGKMRNGGFIASCGDEDRIKEVQRYRNILVKLASVGALFQKVLVENLDYSDVIRVYGRRPTTVLFIDPPYVGTEGHYSRNFRDGQHTLLAHQLQTCAAQVVCTYYDTPLTRNLYPESNWIWNSIAATKNCCLTRGNKVITSEFVLVRKQQNQTKEEEQNANAG